MAESCALQCNCINKETGKVVESRLFKDLLRFSPNRTTAVNYYGLATNPKFLEQVKDTASFDENGEITFQSLRELANLDISEDAILSRLKKELGEGSYSYNEAYTRVSNFNRASTYKNKYLATLEEDGKNYKVTIVENTPRNRDNLETVLKNRSLTDKLVFLLNQAGVNVEFLEEGADVNYAGRYSTQNAERTADLLYTLIQIAHGESSDKALAEEAGHFVIGALDNSPLVERLLKTLSSKEVQEELIRKMGNDKVLGKNPARELAGALVGEALAGEADTNSRFYNLVQKIVNLAKRTFYKIKGDDVKAAVIKAREEAERLAVDFATGNFQGTVENALKTEETLFEASTPYAKTLKDTIAKLSDLSDELKRLDISDTSLKGTIDDITFDAMKKSLEVQGIFDEVSSIEGIAATITSLTSILQNEVPQLLESVRVTDDMNFFSNMSTYAKSLQKIRKIATTTAAIISMVNDVASPYSSNVGLEFTFISSADGSRVSPAKPLRELSSTLNSVLMSTIIPYLKEREFALFLRFLEDSYGSKYINTATKMVFKGLKVIQSKGGKKSIESLLTNLEHDITPIQKALTSMSNNPDLIGQILDKVAKQGNRVRDSLVENAWERLEVLRKELMDLGVTNTDKFYARNSDGELTGYLVSSDGANWGLFEEDYEAFKSECREEFRELYPDIISKSSTEVSLLWQKFFHKKHKEWMKIHATKEKLSDNSFRYIPNLKFDDGRYSDPGYDKLTRKEKVWLRKFMGFYNELRQAIPEGSMPELRAPQFKGTFTNQIANRAATQSKFKAFGSTITRNIFDTFCETSEDRDYGSDQTINSDEEDITDDIFSNADERANRVPLFGINLMRRVATIEVEKKDKEGNVVTDEKGNIVKVKKVIKKVDTSDLSTDLFGSTLAFACMAYTYQTRSQLVDVMEVGKQVLAQRKVKVKGKRSKEIDLEHAVVKGKMSNAYTRAIKYIDKQIYGIGQTKIKLGKKLVLNKVIGAMSSFAGKYFLGGNVIGGVVNLNTGMLEILKEAIADDAFSVNDLRVAVGEYFKLLVGSQIGEVGAFRKGDKLSLLIRRFDVLDDNLSKYWGSSATKSRYLRSSFNIFNTDNLLLPYSAGEHFMQTVPFLAILRNTYVYDQEGNRVSLLDAYETEDIIDPLTQKITTSEGKKYGQTLRLKGMYVKDFSDIPEEIQKKYNITDANSTIAIGQKLNTLIQKLTNDIAKSTNTLTAEDTEFINSLGYEGRDINFIRAELNNDVNKILFNEDAEAALANKIREISIRMHGIYNNSDKTVWHQNMLTNALLAMRGYALGMALRRFGRSYYSISLQEEVEGSLLTSLKVAAYSVTDKNAFRLGLRALFLPFSDKTKESLEKAGFSKGQTANIRRNAGDVLVLLFLSLLKFLTGPDFGKGDDDEEDDILMGALYYFACRAFREQAAFNTPRYFREEAANLTELMPAGFSAVIDFSTNVYNLIAAQFYSSDPKVNAEASKYYYMRDDKYGRYKKGDVKAWVKLQKKAPYWRTIITGKAFYESSKGYEYSRKQRY